MSLATLDDVAAVADEVSNGHSSLPAARLLRAVCRSLAGLAAAERLTVSSAGGVHVDGEYRLRRELFNGHGVWEKEDPPLPPRVLFFSSRGKWMIYSETGRKGYVSGQGGEFSPLGQWTKSTALHPVSDGASRGRCSARRTLAAACEAVGAPLGPEAAAVADITTLAAYYAHMSLQSDSGSVQRAVELLVASAESTASPPPSPGVADRARPRPPPLAVQSPFARSGRSTEPFSPGTASASALGIRSPLWWLSQPSGSPRGAPAAGPAGGAASPHCRGCSTAWAAFHDRAAPRQAGSAPGSPPRRAPTSPGPSWRRARSQSPLAPPASRRVASPDAVFEIRKPPAGPAAGCGSASTRPDPAADWADALTDRQLLAEVQGALVRGFGSVRGALSRVSADGRRPGGDSGTVEVAELRRALDEVGLASLAQRVFDVLGADRNGRVEAREFRRQLAAAARAEDDDLSTASHRDHGVSPVRPGCSAPPPSPEQPRAGGAAAGATQHSSARPPQRVSRRCRSMLLATLAAAACAASAAAGAWAAATGLLAVPCPRCPAQEDRGAGGQCAPGPADGPPRAAAVSSAGPERLAAEARADSRPSSVRHNLSDEQADLQVATLERWLGGDADGLAAQLRLLAAATANLTAAAAAARESAAKQSDRGGAQADALAAACAAAVQGSISASLLSAEAAAKASADAAGALAQRIDAAEAAAKAQTARVLSAVAEVGAAAERGRAERRAAADRLTQSSVGSQAAVPPQEPLSAACAELRQQVSEGSASSAAAAAASRELSATAASSAAALARLQEQRAELHAAALGLRATADSLPGAAGVGAAEAAERLLRSMLAEHRIADGKRQEAEFALLREAVSGAAARPCATASGAPADATQGADSAFPALGQVLQRIPMEAATLAAAAAFAVLLCWAARAARRVFRGRCAAVSLARHTLEGAERSLRTEIEASQAALWSQVLAAEQQSLRSRCTLLGERAQRLHHETAWLRGEWHALGREVQDALEGLSPRRGQALEQRWDHLVRFATAVQRQWERYAEAAGIAANSPSTPGSPLRAMLATPRHTGGAPAGAAPAAAPS
eukprot:TRINITY_DN26995_c0_g1_i8.p1 TRINITY_DN26995_c0_g1~~TRINITY_DN26995_c0_g1_i8.p1  ORF type:complete len:1107 (+),score=147.03 TRINITY_DN26995_c0_g1_i8:89-3322(+)